MSASLDHVSFVATDLDTTAAFYDAALGAAGIGRVVAWQDIEDVDEVGAEAVGYGTDASLLLWIVAGKAPTTGAHVAFQVATEFAVDAVGVATGGVPRRRRHDRRGYYGLMVGDPDGNTLEVFSAG